MARSVTYQPRLDDTIVAPATAAGPAALAIVRLSGPEAHVIAAQIIRTNSPSAAPGMMRRGTIRNAAGERIDDALVVHWNSPHSATGEDIAELHTHGAPAIVRAVVEAALAHGARAAEPGEFTRRACLNGKLDLAQAEAIGVLSRAATDEAARAAFAQLSGGLSELLRRIRTTIIEGVAMAEAIDEFPEDTASDGAPAWLARFDDAIRELDDLLGTFQRGRLLTQGARVVLAGAPNAGKSSLLNALLKRERALVSPHAGTTRDAVEASIDFRGVPLTLVDTAGLREAGEEIETLGMERTRTELQGADLIVFVSDASVPMGWETHAYRDVADLPHIVVINKSDLCNADLSPGELAGSGRRGTAVKASAKLGDIAGVEEAMATALGLHSGESREVVLTSARHESLLRTARAHLAKARQNGANAATVEFVSVDAAEALAAIDGVLPSDGSTVDEAVLDAIFLKFCIGK